MVSVPTENDRYITFITTYPQVMPIHLTLYGQRCIRYENIFTSCERGPQDIPRSPWPRCVAMTQSHGRCYNPYLLRWTVLK
jgi:hypothetical protein